jgi:predicted deacylase
MAELAGAAAKAGIGDPSSPHYPRPFNPTGPYAHGFPIVGSPPDIAPWAAGNAGIPFLWRFDGAAPGPHAAIVALTHGEEWCGAVALDGLLRGAFRPAHGTLSLLFANHRAHARWDPAQPNRAFYIDRDLNRVWDAALLDGDAQGWELARARELRPWLETVDVLLDLHSTQQPSPPMVFCGAADKTVAFAQALGWPRLLIRDMPHAAGRRMRDYGGFDDPADPRIAIVAECGQHWAEGAARNAIAMVARFLAQLGMAPPDAPPEWSGPRGTVQVTHQITAAEGAALDQAWPDFAIVAKAGTRLGENGGVPVVTPYDDAVLLMPARRPRPGTTMLRIGRFTPDGD